MKHRAISSLECMSPLCLNFSLLVKLKFLPMAYKAKHLSLTLSVLQLPWLFFLLLEHTKRVLNSGVLHLRVCLESSPQSCLLI